MNVNVRPEMLRQPGMGQPPMLGLSNPPFMQSSPQPGQQQQLGMPSSNVPPMGMLGGGPPNQNPSIQHPRYAMSVQQQHPSAGPAQRPMLMRPAPPMNPPAGGAHMNINFGNGPMMQQQQQQSIANRRVSQGQPLPPGGNHIGSLPMQGNMPAHMRQPQQAHGQPQQPPMRQPSGHISPELAMAMRNTSGNPGLPQNVVRTGSTSMGMMNGIPQSGQPQSMQGAMQSSHQNNFQSPVPLPLQHQTAQIPPSPRPPSHPSSHTPAMNMGPGPSQPGINRPQMPPDNPMAFMDFSTPQFSTQTSSGGNNQFPFVPSSTPPTQMGEMSRALPTNIANTPPNRTAFQLTPAQQFEAMQQQGTENYNSFGMPPPPRPPSHNPHHASLPQSQPSSHPPSPSDNVNTYPRPSSRPRSQSGRPSSSHTPRITQSQLPTNNALAAGGRIPSQHTGPQPQPGLQPPPVLNSSQPAGPPRPPNQPQGNLAHGSPASSSTVSSTDQHPSAPAPRPPPVNVVATALGSGQGLTRLLQFSGNLSNESKTKLQLSWWNDLIKEYFTPRAVMKITLWKDNQKTEAKPFEIGVPILPRFFLVTTQSGVKSMTLTLDGARERMYAQGHSVVECVTAVWTYKYNNGYTVTLRGPLTAHVVVASPQAPATNHVLKFDDFQFDANYHDKFISIESIMGQRMIESPKTPRIRNAPTPIPNGFSIQDEEDKKWEEPRIIIERGSIPGEPVNAFGIPQATMRCLELAESVAQMTDLITFSNDTKLGPIDALNKYADRLRGSMPILPPLSGGQHMINGMNQMNPNVGMMSHPFGSFPTSSPMGSTTLYSSAPPSVTNPAPLPQPQAPSSSISSPQNAPPSAHNSPTKQHKTIPHNQNASSSTASSSTPTSTANTPALSNASLKRKQPSGNISPTTGSDQPPPKRATRKRGRTTGGG
ncbi:LIM-domain binding protein-domain-containing protein [Armillaria novae-zelandiae]|uniref:LIM-domain binding protein-domain-containing protein n=1 Tax=Armillaria novae-zelandiae TaxID=153914 RepID=A0AA39TII6_9AGAR|nr:LIM-domain binding protein-domain-containing protein [Armillaria novae-zelandiae]